MWKPLRIERPLQSCHKIPMDTASARTVNSNIGSPVERLEDLRFLRGRGQFVDDVPSPNALHAAILRSAVPLPAPSSIRIAAPECRAIVPVPTLTP